MGACTETLIGSIYQMATKKKTTKAKAKASVRVNVNVNSKNRKVVKGRQHFPAPYPTALPSVRVEVHSSTPQLPIAIHQPPMMRDTIHSVGMGTQTPQVAEEVHPLPLRVSPSSRSSASYSTPSTRSSSASSHARPTQSEIQPHPHQVPPSRNYTREALHYGTSLAQSAAPRVLEMGAGAVGTLARGALSVAPPLARMGAGAVQSAVPAVAGIGADMARGLYQYATRPDSSASRHSSVASSTHLVPTSTRFESPPPDAEPRRGNRVRTAARQYSPSGQPHVRRQYG
jgi:hypothetical protein